MKLYEISESFRRIDALIDDAEGELDGSLEAALDALESSLVEKADSLAALVRERQAASQAFQEQASFFAAKSRVEANAADRLKAYLHRTMIALGRGRIEGERFTVAIQRNGRPSIRCLADPASLPPAYRRTEIAFNSAEAWLAHQRGEALPDGVVVEHGSHLRIK